MKDQIDRKHDSDGVSAFQKLAWILGSLLAVAFFTALYFGIKSNRLLNEKSELHTNLTDLDEQKSILESDLTVLDSNYQVQISTNDTLKTTLEERVAEVKELKARIWTAKQKLNESEEENKAINDRLAQLEELKVQLEEDIVALEGTNMDLKNVNDELSSELKVSKEEAIALNREIEVMTEKNEQLIDRLYTLAPAGFIADNFAVTAAKRNDKITAKARKAETINVSFDINDVPGEYQEDEQLYLVLTKFDGNPVEEVVGREIELTTKSPMAFNAVDIQETTLRERQNIEMSFDTNRDLESGMYNLMVYADHGFLGATTFSLR